MSDYHIYIKMPSYLRQWFVHRHSGTEPVRLRNGSIESKLIKLAVVKPPVSAIPTRQREDEVAICIPYSKTRDPRIYNHITDTGKRALLENVKNSFDVDCWTFLHDFGRIGKQQKDLIPDFVIASPKNLHQRVWRFSDALPSTLSECIHPCSEVA